MTTRSCFELSKDIMRLFFLDIVENQIKHRKYLRKLFPGNPANELF